MRKDHNTAGRTRRLVRLRRCSRPWAPRTVRAGRRPRGGFATNWPPQRDRPGAEPLRAKEIAAVLGIDAAVAARVEGVRSKTKRLTEPGWLFQEASGAFSAGRRLVASPGGGTAPCRTASRPRCSAASTPRSGTNTPGTTRGPTEGLSVLQAASFSALRSSSEFFGVLQKGAPAAPGMPPGRPWEGVWVAAGHDPGGRGRALRPRLPQGPVTPLRIPPRIRPDLAFRGDRAYRFPVTSLHEPS